MSNGISSLETRHLFDLELRVPAVEIIGGPARRRFALIEGGKFSGERLRGSVRPGGGDWIAIRDDGATLLDARAVLETDDGALIGLSWTGIRHGPAEVMQQIASGSDVDPSSYYFRSIFSFDTFEERYEWLNRIIALATGKRNSDGVEYSVYELL